MYAIKLYGGLFNIMSNGVKIDTVERKIRYDKNKNRYIIYDRKRINIK